MTIAARIKASLTASGLKKSELARRVGVTPGAVTQWLTGETKSLKGTTLVNIANALNVSSQWLETGAGGISKPEHLDLDEQALLSVARELTPANLSALMSIAITLRSSQTDSGQTAATPFTVKVPS